MFGKEEVADEEGIFIYEKMTPTAATDILLAKVGLQKNTPYITSLQENSGKLWLIRDSRVSGLLTVESIIYDKGSATWKNQEPQRFMLSAKGWVVNNADPNSKDFAEVAAKNKMIHLTEESATPHLPSLLARLEKEGYLLENRVNPPLHQQTKTKGYSQYAVGNVPKGHKIKLQSTELSLPEGILIALSCPLTTQKTGQCKLMRDPVTWALDGVTYERSTLLAQNPTLHEGIDYYPNTKLKTIISYVSATHLPPQEYLAKLAKVEEDIKDPISLETMEEPMLSPSGHSFSKESIEGWLKEKHHQAIILDPVAHVDIKGKALIKNNNLAHFIKAWPAFYGQQREHMATKQVALAVQQKTRTSEDIDNSSPPEKPINKQLQYNYNYHRRFHFYTLQQGGLKGDALKKEILSSFRDRLKETTSPEELEQVVCALMNSAEYKILQTGQGITTRALKLKTSSVEAFEKMVDDQVAFIAGLSPGLP